MKAFYKGQLALALGVCAVGLFFLLGSFQIPDAAGYSTVGPKLVPRWVGIVLLVLSGFLVFEVVRGGFKHHDEEAEQKLPTDWVAFAWISAGLIIYGLTIERLGFIIASVLLFVCTARGFYSKRWIQNTIVGLIMAGLIFAGFNYGLGLNLPKGILSGVL
jgi:putative tricarboxylic transport membrane protein